MYSRKRLVVVVAILLTMSPIVLSGCTSEPQTVVQTREVTVEVPVTVIVQAPTLEPLPTYTPYPTYTAVPKPTDTPTATRTSPPTATATPAATSTLSPTATATPTATPTLSPTATATPTATPTLSPTATATPKPTLTAKELDEQLAAQPLSVVRTRYIVQSEDYKTLHPDMLSAELRNNGEHDIRDVVLAFAAWDANGLPILLRGNLDVREGTYVRKVKATGINLVPEAEWGQNMGFSIEEDLEVDTFAALVVSFTTFDDEVWENPYLDEWMALYEGKRRPD